MCKINENEQISVLDVWSSTDSHGTGQSFTQSNHRIMKGYWTVEEWIFMPLVIYIPSTLAEKLTASLRII